MACSCGLMATARGYAGPGGGAAGRALECAALSPTLQTMPANNESRLLALSPLDGRYAGKVDALRPIFSEFGLIKARVKVEVEWLLALANEPRIAELAPFSPAATARLRKLADELSVEDAARVKEIE